MEVDTVQPETAQMDASAHHDQVIKCKEDQVSTSEYDASLKQGLENTQKTKDIQNGKFWCFGRIYVELNCLEAAR